MVRVTVCIPVGMLAVVVGCCSNQLLVRVAGDAACPLG